MCEEFAENTGIVGEVGGIRLLHGMPPEAGDAGAPVAVDAVDGVEENVAVRLLLHHGVVVMVE